MRLRIFDNLIIPISLLYLFFSLTTVTIFAKEILDNYDCVDYICVGEGEELICRLTNGQAKEEIEGLLRMLSRILISSICSFKFSAPSASSKIFLYSSNSLQ